MTDALQTLEGSKKYKYWKRQEEYVLTYSALRNRQGAQPATGSRAARRPNHNVLVLMFNRVAPLRVKPQNHCIVLRLSTNQSEQSKKRFAHIISTYTEARQRNHRRYPLNNSTWESTSSDRQHMTHISEITATPYGNLCDVEIVQCRCRSKVQH